VEGYQQAWDDALAQEHLHQRELLATLREELGTFARECAAALDALTALTGVSEVVASAASTYKQAKLAYDAGRRLPELTPAGAPVDQAVADLYRRLGREKPAPTLLRHASELVGTEPKRSDWELLRAAVDLEGIPARLDEAIGPGLTTAVEAIAPLAHWVPTFARLRRREIGAEAALEQAAKDLTTILDGVPAVSDVTQLGTALRDTVAHVEAAADAVEHGKLEQVLAEARGTLEADLAALRSVIDGAASSDWREARDAEHEALTDEVNAKLEKVERTRRVLAALLPRVRVIARALTAAERFEAVERRLEPDAAANIDAARMALLIDLSGVWEEVVRVGEWSMVSDVPATRRRRKRLAVAVLALLLVGGGAALAVVLSTGGSGKTAASTTTTSTTTTTTTTPVPTTTKAAPAPATPSPQPRLSPVTALFNLVQRETVYSVTVTAKRQGTPAISWRLATPPGNPTCNKFAPVAGHPNQAVWHHADTDGCTHTGIQHDGWIYATVTTDAWVCTQKFFGTLSHTGTNAERCRKR
jgi:hypothetical protein